MFYKQPLQVKLEARTMHSRKSECSHSNKNECCIFRCIQTQQKSSGTSCASGQWKNEEKWGMKFIRRTSLSLRRKDSKLPIIAVHNIFQGYFLYFLQIFRLRNSSQFPTWAMLEPIRHFLLSQFNFGGGRTSISQNAQRERKRRQYYYTAAFLKRRRRRKPSLR